jgi:uncharacterized protein YjbJ (UPF0337 family)
MNTSHVEGAIDQAKGKVKQAIGETFNNQSLANQGAADQVKGNAKEAWGNVKDAASDLTSRDAAEAQAHGDATGHDLRSKITHAAESAKESIDRGIENLKHNK